MISVVGAYIITDKKILLARRSRGELAGSWEFPGGKIEEGESEEEAIVREIGEELGIGVMVVRRMGVFRHVYPFAEIELALMECIREDSTIQLSDSHSEYRWVTLEEARSLALAPLDLEIISYLLTQTE